MSKGKERKKKVQSDIKWKDSVKTRLITSMLLVAAVPLIIAVIISYYTSTTKAKADAIDSLEWQAWYVEAAIQNVIQSNESSITSFADSPTTVAYMKGEEVNMDDLKDQMKSIDEYLNDGNVLVITNAQGQMVLRDDDGKLANISERE